MKRGDFSETGSEDRLFCRGEEEENFSNRHFSAEVKKFMRKCTDLKVCGMELGYEVLGNGFA